MNETSKPLQICERGNTIIDRESKTEKLKI